MKCRKIIILIVVIVLIVAFIPYARVEILTYLHGEQFEELYMTTQMIAGIQYFKVFR